MWKPKLVIRRGRGNAISSPTTTGGYLLNAVIGGVLTAAILAAAVKDRQPLIAFFVFIPGVFLRDCWAWFAADEAERNTFTAEVAAAGGGPSQQKFGTDWGWGATAGFGLLSVVCFVLVSRNELFLLPALFSSAFCVATLVDRLK